MATVPREGEPLVDARLAAFVFVAALLVVTPGADMALVTKNALAFGRDAARKSTLGICLGLVVWGIIAAAGIGAVFSASPLIFNIIKLSGAVYLIFLGLRTLSEIRQCVGQAASTFRDMPLVPAVAFRQGLVTNLLNPKIAVFYTTLLPQFIAPGQSVVARSLLLVAIHVGLTYFWLRLYGSVITFAHPLFRRPVTERALRAATGLILVGLGVALACTHR
jgi:threonine/homoserine/homoserine lactone efflux protein